MQQNVDKKLLNFKSKKNMQQNVDKAIIFGIRQQIVIKHLKNLFTIEQSFFGTFVTNKYFISE
jgi:hypothetical protein